MSNLEDARPADESAVLPGGADVVPEDWFVRAFGPEYRALYQHRNDDLAEVETSFVEDRVALAGARLLDLGCGAGRHSVRFAATGARVVGLDLSEDLTHHANEKLPGRIVRADMRRLPFAPASFDIVTSMFTSFGYFADGENSGVAGEISRVLRVGGHAVFDLMNAKFVEDHLVPESVREVGGRTVREQRRIRGRRVEKETRIDGQGEPFIESVRLFEPGEIEALLANASLRVTSFHGDFTGSKFDITTSPRMILTCERLRP